jgi:hypothetical protein
MGLQPTQGNENGPQARRGLAIPSEVERSALSSYVAVAGRVASLHWNVFGMEPSVTQPASPNPRSRLAS